MNQGDIYWIDLDDPSGATQGVTRPHVVIQNNVLNQSRIQTVIVVAVTSNLKRAAAPGNVLLQPGEAGLPKQSVVTVTEIFTVGKAQLGDYIGTLSRQRVRGILDGLRRVLEPADVL